MSKDNPPTDDTSAASDPAAKPIEENIKSRATWTRLLYMVICCFLISLASFVGTFVVVLGFFWVAFDARKQGWHDKIARTVVIREKS